MVFSGRSRIHNEFGMFYIQSVLCGVTHRKLS